MGRQREGEKETTRDGGGGLESDTGDTAWNHRNRFLPLMLPTDANDANELGGAGQRQCVTSYSKRWFKHSTWARSTSGRASADIPAMVPIM